MRLTVCALLLLAACATPRVAQAQGTRMYVEATTSLSGVSSNAFEVALANALSTGGTMSVTSSAF
jgi:ACR3 family arsenite efflux pump ArsB